MTREHFEKDQEKFKGSGSTVSTPTLRIIETPEPAEPEPPPEEEVPKEE